VRIRILFRNEKWDLTLPDATSEAVIELSGIAAPNTPRDVGPINEVDLFVKGTAELKVRNRTVPLPNKSWVTWSSANQEASGPVEVPQLPPWWTGSLNLKDDLVAESVLVLTEFHEVIKDSGSVLRAVVEEMGKKPDDAAVWSMGMLFLAALDALPQVVDVLVEARNEFARLAARMALQQWISRSPDNQRELERFLREQKIYSPDKAQLVVRLLRGFSPDALKKPETYAQLIGHLNHSDFIVRDLAWWHLAYLDEAKDLNYEPAAPPEKREPAVAELKKRLPDGQVPKRQGKPSK
jgi:hypothetical protein